MSSSPPSYPLGTALWGILVRWVPYLAGLTPAAAAMLGALLIPVLDEVARHFLSDLVAAQILTVASGYHFAFDPEHPGRPPRLLDAQGRDVRHERS